MQNDKLISDQDIDSLYTKLKQDAESAGYHLNPEIIFTRELVESLLINQKRYGYQTCPCRLASGIKTEDLDIICPCDYRDPDLDEYEMCYCGLYVSDAVLKGKTSIGRIPERRPPEQERKQKTPLIGDSFKQSLTYPVWRCKVCGYLCARDMAPGICPICKATKERFERFL